MATSLIQLLPGAVAFGTVIMFGCIGEIITEKAGNLNLGVPGIMYLGGIASLASVFIYEGSTDINRFRGRGCFAFLCGIR